MNDRKESAVEMLHALKDAIRTVEKISNYIVTSVKYDFKYNVDVHDPDWEQCKEVYSKIPRVEWLNSKYGLFERNWIFKVGDVQMQYLNGWINDLQLEVDGNWYNIISDIQASPFIVEFCYKTCPHQMHYQMH